MGIETVGDLIGKTEDDPLHIDGIGAKAIEELREGLQARNLLYILEPDDDAADEEDLSQLLNMVFSPDGGDDVYVRVRLYDASLRCRRRADRRSVQGQRLRAMSSTRVSIPSTAPPRRS